MSLPAVNFLSITESQWKTMVCVDVTNQLKNAHKLGNLVF